MIWIELAVVIAAILIGARLGGLGLGLTGGLGLLVLTFGFGLEPTAPPIDVILIIATVISAVSIMQAAGGLDYMVEVAAKILRRHPQRVTFLAPLVTYAFTFVAGTGHIAYALLPVIAEVSRKTGIRPERPMSISVIASQQAITASPISAATAVLLIMLADFQVTLIDILLISIPATLTGVILGALSVLHYGKDLKYDKTYLARLEAGEFSEKENPGEKLESTKQAKFSVLLFLLAVASIVLISANPALLPSWMDEATSAVRTLQPSVVIRIVMLAIGAITMLVCRVKGSAIAHSSVFSTGMQAVIAILGIAWMGDTFIQAHMAEIKQAMMGYVELHSWTFAIALFLMSILLYSQAATLRALLPLGIALGIPAPALVAMFPSVNGYFFIPNYPTIIAAISFDRTGTTRIGRFLLNHSFMLPGMVATIASVAAGYLLAYIFL